MRKRYGALLLTFLFILALGLTACEPVVQTMGDQAAVVISEIMAKNNGVLADDEGNYSDWIELYNRTDSVVRLENYSLTDNAKNRKKFVFPDIEIQPGEYFVIFATGTEFVDIEKRIIHLPFSVNSTSEDFYLYDAAGRELSCVEVRDLPENTTCGQGSDGSTVYFRFPTPGEANSETYTPTTPTTPAGPVTPTAEATVRLNEYAPGSSITLADEDGDFTPWVELYNYGEKPVTLTSFTLSDDPVELSKWVFPAVTIPAGGYQVVYLSGKTKEYTEGGALHASFRLTGEEQSLTLYGADGRRVDTCSVYELTSNLSYGRTTADTEKWAFFARPTPGKANDTTSFDSIDSARYPQNKTTVISEVAAVNRTGATASDKQTYDFIELYNPTDKPVSLNGYRLSDKDDPAEWRTLPDVQLNPGEYKVIYCGDVDKYNRSTGEIFIAMGLNRYGEHLYLADADGVVVDDLAYGRLDDAQSGGRVSMTETQVYYFEQVTPGAANPSAGLKPPAPTPVFSVSSGYVESGTKVTISCRGATIRYTTDGSTPTKDSPVYTGELTISSNITIRARAFMDGRLPSDDSAGSYLVGRRHDMPVIFLSTDPANLYDYNTGILADGPGYNKTQESPHTGANYWQDWERPIHFEYVDENGVAQLEFNAGVKVFGQYSRDMPQKSLAINLKDKYGPTEICYPLFGDGAATNVFSSLVLRNSGQDGYTAHIRDAYITQVLKGQVDVDFMDYRPVVVYINGEYNGLYDLRERIDESYIANRTGADEDNVDLIKGNSIVNAGSMDAYRELLAYANGHDLSQKENYDHVASLVDIEELIDYWITISFFGNTDTGNIRFYRERADGAKWRWVVYDQDWALYPSTAHYNQVEEVINPNGHGVGHMFNTDLMRALMKNSGFRDQFISTYGERLRTTFATERLLSIFDEMIAEIQTEMPYHIEKWETPGSVATWERSVKTLRGIIEKRNAKVRQDVIETFSCTGVSAPTRYADGFELSVEQVEKLLG